jgi:ferredoxin-NADP reductase
MDTRLEFASRREVATDVWEFCFVATQPLDFTPGQYAHLQLPQASSEQPRAFSLTSLPDETEVRFITRYSKPPSLYKQALFALQPSDPALLREPMGDCVLPRAADTPVVFVAQGIAIASYIAILTNLCARLCARLDLAHRSQKEVTSQVCARSNLAQTNLAQIAQADLAQGRKSTLIWIRRSEDDTLENLIPGEVPCLKRIDIQYPDRLQAQTVLEHVDDKTLIYLSGSQRFVESLGLALENAGIARARLVYDYYDGYAEL